MTPHVLIDFGTGEIDTIIGEFLGSFSGGVVNVSEHAENDTHTGIVIPTLMQNEGSEECTDGDADKPMEFVAACQDAVPEEPAEVDMDKKAEMQWEVSESGVMNEVPPEMPVEEDAEGWYRPYNAEVLW